MEPTTPTTQATAWPGAFGLYRTAKRVTKVNIQPVIVVYLLSIAVNILVSILLGRKLQWLGEVISFLIGILVTTAIVSCYLNALDGKQVDTSQAVSTGFKHYIDMFFGVLLMYVLSVVSLVLLIVPFFFVFPRLLLTPYFLIDKNAGPVQAVKDSWEATKGNVGKMYGILGVNVVYSLLFISIIGIPFAIYFLVMYSSATAILYRQLTGQNIQFETKQS